MKVINYWMKGFYNSKKKKTHSLNTNKKQSKLYRYKLDQNIMTDKYNYNWKIIGMLYKEKMNSYNNYGQLNQTHLRIKNLT